MIPFGDEQVLDCAQASDIHHRSSETSRLASLARAAIDPAMSRIHEARLKLRGEVEAPPALRRFGSGWISGVIGLVLGGAGLLPLTSSRKRNGRVATACNGIRSPDSKLSAKNTSGSLAMPTSPGYFAARPEADVSYFNAAG
jgi:hypothetical protein